MFGNESTYETEADEYYRKDGKIVGEYDADGSIHMFLDYHAMIENTVTDTFEYFDSYETAEDAENAIFEELKNRNQLGKGLRYQVLRQIV